MEAIKLIREIVALEVGRVFKDNEPLNLDECDLTFIAATLEEQFDITIDEEMEDFVTINSIVALVNKTIRS